MSASKKRKKKDLQKTKFKFIKKNALVRGTKLDVCIELFLLNEFKKIKINEG